MTSEQIESIIEYKDLSAEFFTWQIGNCDESIDEEDRFTKFYEEEILTNCIEDDEKVFALMEHTGETYEEAESVIDSNYRVLTDEEADKTLNKYLEEYVEDNVLYQIPIDLRVYFNTQAWIEDNNSDRGTWLNYVNGEEYTETINGTTYYIYNI